MRGCPAAMTCSASAACRRYAALGPPLALKPPPLHTLSSRRSATFGSGSRTGAAGCSAVAVAAATRAGALWQSQQRAKFRKNRCWRQLHTSMTQVRSVATTSDVATATEVPSISRSAKAVGLLRRLLLAQDTLPPLVEDTHRVADMNFGFMYLKPHANTEAARQFLSEKLKSFGVKICEEGEIGAEEIDTRRIIDVHYGSLAAKAWTQSPADLVVREESLAVFKEQFGIAWPDALARGLVCNAREALERLACSEDELDDEWTPLELGKGKVKLGGGFYVGLIKEIFVVNGFYMAMRSMYTKPGRSVHWYSVSWPASDMRWSKFRSDVLGDTDPATASSKSLRGSMYAEWQALGLPREPSVGENVVHASASPFEAFVERVNWLAKAPQKDSFGSQLTKRGIPQKVLQGWSEDPVVSYQGRQWSLFDLFENLDGKDCIERADELHSGGTRGAVESSEV